MKSMKFLCALSIAVAGVFTAGVAQANEVVRFGYEVTSSPQAAEFTFDGSSLEMSGPTTIDFWHDLSAIGTPRGEFINATLRVETDVVSSMNLGSGMYYTFEGSAWVTSDGGSAGDVIVIDLDGATMFVPNGSITSALTLSVPTGPSRFDAGSELQAALGSYELVTRQTAAFTLTNINSTGPDSWTAESSFSASSQVVIPEPGMTVLAGLGTLMILPRRRFRSAA